MMRMGLVFLSLGLAATLARAADAPVGPARSPYTPMGKAADTPMVKPVDVPPPVIVPCPTACGEKCSSCCERCHDGHFLRWLCHREARIGYCGCCCDARFPHLYQYFLTYPCVGGYHPEAEPGCANCCHKGGCASCCK
jgi:hypothetical protein